MGRNNDKSKYSHDDRICIAQSIENLKNHEDYAAIFEILMGDKTNSYMQNSNGVFLNLSLVSDSTLGNIKRYLSKIKKLTPIGNEIDIDVIPNTGSSKNNRQYKLSNYEKNIIKQRNLKKVLNEDDEYEELEFVAKNKKQTVAKKRIIKRESNC